MTISKRVLIIVGLRGSIEGGRVVWGWGEIKGGPDRPFSGERVGGCTNFSAREKENTWNWGNFVHFWGSEDTKIAQTSLLGPF
jgi:hypothetical protein